MHRICYLKVLIRHSDFTFDAPSHLLRILMFAGPRAIPMTQIAAQGLPAAAGAQWVIGQPANAIIPQQAPGQGGMILLNTSQGPILIPTNCASMMPGLQLAMRQPMSHTPPPSSVQALNHSQLLAPLQVSCFLSFIHYFPFVADLKIFCISFMSSCYCLGACHLRFSQS